ncbi:ABC transporter ATP-binding protein (plasmid) [Streptomyces sp. CG4]|uniref:ABC transporter ATP-binding protein n=1 Tax=Streptomyces sp. CG4 TaxID=408783 RepID=UPI0034E27A6A
MSLKPTPAWKLVREELTHNRPALRRLAAWSALSVLPVLAEGRVVQLAGDRGFLAGAPWTGMAYLTLAVAAFAIGALATRCTLASLADVVEPLRDRLMRRVVTGELHRAVTGRGRLDPAAAARLTAQIEVVRDLLGGLLATVLSLVFSLAAVALGLFALHPLLAALITVPVLVSLVLFGSLLPLLHTRQWHVLRAEEHVSAVITQAVEGTRDAIACGAEERLAAEVEAAVDQQAASERGLARVQALRTAALAIGLYMPPLLLVAVAEGLRARGVTTGALLGAGTYILGGVTPALRRFTGAVGSSGLKLTVVLKNVTTAGHRPVSTRAAQDARTAPVPRGSELELREVSFAYGPHARVVDGLSLRLEPGSRLAVVGPSGAGKSTLADLMTGVLAPDTGRVLLGGVPTCVLSGQVRRDHIAVVPQEAYVFAGTLRDNLTYLVQDATDRDIDAAVSRFELTSVAARIGGYDTPFDPHSLSAGERQLVSLARADLQGAPLTVLDEATSALDAATEARVEEALRARGGTVVVIAHRISSALRADTVLVLDADRSDIGTHGELLTRCPLYADLVGHWYGSRPEPAEAAALPVAS